MGFSLSWVAVKGKSSSEVNQILKLVPTGECEEVPESVFTAAVLPDGFYLITFNQDLVGDRELRELSRNNSLVACFVEEHVMVSAVSVWENGRKQWSLMHDGQKGSHHLERNGEIPHEISHHIDKIFKDMEGSEPHGDEVDYIFDIPVDTAAELTGYRHDAMIDGAGELPFEVLVKQEPKKSQQGGILGFFRKKT